MAANDENEKIVVALDDTLDGILTSIPGMESVIDKDKLVESMRDVLPKLNEIGELPTQDIRELTKPEGPLSEFMKGLVQSFTGNEELANNMMGMLPAIGNMAFNLKERVEQHPEMMERIKELTEQQDHLKEVYGKQLLGTIGESGKIDINSMMKLFPQLTDPTSEISEVMSAYDQETKDLERQSNALMEEMMNEHPEIRDEFVEDMKEIIQTSEGIRNVIGETKGVVINGKPQEGCVLC